MIHSKYLHKNIFKGRNATILVTMTVIVMIVLIVILKTLPNNATISREFTWNCINDKCVRNICDNDDDCRMIQSFKVCKLLCGPSIIWPKPVRYSIKGPPIYIKNITVTINKDMTKYPEMKRLSNRAIGIFKNRIEKEGNVTSVNSEDYNLRVTLTLNDLKQTQLTLDTNEKYDLYTTKYSSTKKEIDVLISGATFFGVRHGLETLSQLIIYDNFKKTLAMPNKINVEDYPKYKYRGFMLDTARNYITVESIKRTIDGMAANKMNRFHWHITDTQSFPLKIEKYKNFAKYGAYSPEQVYTEEDVKSIVDFGSVRGIRVIPELDTPAHTGEGWVEVVPDLAMCFDRSWGTFCYEPPCEQLNPLKDNVYEILGGFYEEYMRLFQTDIFHMGGDEVSFNCWKTSRKIRRWFKNYKTDIDGFFALWNKFQMQAYNKLINASETKHLKPPDVILWSSKLIKELNVQEIKKSDYIIQMWGKMSEDTELMTRLLKAGVRIIISNYDKLYLDCGFGSWTSDKNNWCSPYNTWPTIYENKLNTITKPFNEDQRNLILGQEAALWTETAGEESLDSRVWPRVAALAERTWSDPSSSWLQAEGRMLYHRNRLVKNLGIKADSIEPEWCNLNPGGCGSL